MKKLTLFIHILITLCILRGFENKLDAQNLVKNPSFENYFQCPISWGLYNGYVQDWFGFTTGSFSNFLHACAPLPDRMPENSFGWQMAKSGNGYSCILVYYLNFNPDHRSYIEGEFTNALEKDSVYCVQYWVSLCDRNSRPIKELDAHLSDTLLDWNNGISFNLLGVIPQVRSNQILEDSVGWTKVSALFVAHGGEKYITIGNFNDDIHTTTDPPDDGLMEHAFMSYYYIDDVSVTLIGASAPFLGADTLICKNQTPFMLNAPLGYDSYLWSNGSINSSIAVSDSGTYWVKCVMNGCGELSDVIHIGFLNTPTLNLVGDTVICKGSSISLTGQSGFSSYLWSNADTIQTIQVSDAGLYILQASDFCGLQTDSVRVLVDSLPDIVIDLGVDTTVCPSGVYNPITLSPSQLMPNYLWNTGEESAQITVDKKGSYWMKSVYYCGTLYSDTIFVDACPLDTNFNFYIPNSFSPNNDGVNDVFQPVFYNVIFTDAQIFNRWGELIYQSNDKFLWDGKKLGIECPIGVYFYNLRYKDVLENHYQKMGTLNLIR